MTDTGHERQQMTDEHEQYQKWLDEDDEYQKWLNDETGRDIDKYLNDMEKEYGN